jgi:hypothetical protein
MLDGAILYAVREKVPFEGWLHFREYLTTNGCLTARQLDDEERYVLDRYVKHNSDVQLQPRSPPATPPKSPGSEPQTAACNAAPAEPLDAGLGGTFSPLIDDEKTVRNAVQYTALNDANVPIAAKAFRELIDIPRTRAYMGWRGMGLLQA